jgi:cytochrome c peroxidase
MHSGRFETLRESVEFYTKGRGHAVPAGVEMQLHWHIWEPDLTEDELDRIVDFLLTLTDETFMPVTPESVPSGLTPLNNPKDHSTELSHSTIKLRQEERS